MPPAPIEHPQLVGLFCSTEVPNFLHCINRKKKRLTKRHSVPSLNEFFSQRPCSDSHHRVLRRHVSSPSPLLHSPVCFPYITTRQLHCSYDTLYFFSFLFFYRYARLNVLPLCQSRNPSSRLCLQPCVLRT